MKVLVSAATKHGATAEIALAIGTALNDANVEAVVIPPDAVTTVADYDAVVLGSGVYAGRWLDPARKLVDRNVNALKGRPVWLFSSGPVGDPPRPMEDPADIAMLRERTGARDHRIFAGKLIKHELGFAERAIVVAVRAAEGDFRQLAEIEEWAASIARVLKAEAPATEPVPVGSPS